MYPLHPFTVHLPIGLLLGHALLTALYLRSRDTALEVGAFQCLWLGWLGTLLAVISGTLDAARLLGASPREGTLGWINAHALVGIAILVVYWQIWQLRRRHPGILDDPQARRGYLARVALGVTLIVIDGWLGGYLVYTLRVWVGG